MVFSTYGEVVGIYLAVVSESHPVHRSALVDYATEKPARDAIKVLDGSYCIRAGSEPIAVSWAGSGCDGSAKGGGERQSTTPPLSPAATSGNPHLPQGDAVPAYVVERRREEAGEAAVPGPWAPLSPAARATGELLEETTSSVKVSRLNHRTEITREVEEVVVVPVVAQVEKVVEVEVEVVVEEPRFVPSGRPVGQQLQHVEEVEGPVVYVDRIVEVPVDTVVDEPVIVEVERIMPRTYEVVHHVPRFVNVPHVIERLVQRPVQKVVERVVEVQRIVPREVVEWEDVELVREVAKIVEEEVKINLRVQEPRWCTREVPMEVPRMTIDERLVEQEVVVKEEVLQEMTLSEVASQVQIVQQKNEDALVYISKPRYVEVPEVQYIERRVEKPVIRRVPVDVPRDEPPYEVISRRIQRPRIEYRDKVVHVPQVRRQTHSAEVHKEVRTRESHHITGKLTEPAMVKYLERFVDVPKVRTEHIDISVGPVVVQERVEEVPVITEILRYEEVLVDKEVKVRRQRPKYREVERILRVPRYVIEEVPEHVDLVEERLAVTEKEEPLVVERLLQRSRLVQDVKEVVVGRKAGRIPQCLHCLRGMQQALAIPLAADGSSSSALRCAACGRSSDEGGPRWRCFDCDLEVCADCEG
mmetsp:Transcript_116940/g.291827  ORF Transcript_116940/g.291827 Transcript_116940/m.291827 type:complete len:643 (-) Transcript_116940:19-1947(-)